MRSDERVSWTPFRNHKNQTRRISEMSTAIAVPTLDVSFEQSTAITNEARRAKGLVRPLSMDEVTNILASAHIVLMESKQPNGVYTAEELTRIVDWSNETQRIEGCPNLTEDEVRQVLDLAFKNGWLWNATL